MFRQQLQKKSRKEKRQKEETEILLQKGLHILTIKITD